MANTKTDTSTPGEAVGTDAPAAAGSPEPGTGTVVPNDAGDVNAPAKTEESVDFSKITGIKYVGPYDVRVLTAEDLRTLGANTLQSEDDVVWDRSNGKTVAKTDLSAETVTALLRLPEFKAV